MKYGGTVGAAFGFTLEETTAALALFRNLGLEGSLAGTNFRMAMAYAAKGTLKSAAALKELGLQQKDINPEFHSFEEIMTTLGNSSMTTTQAIDIFGKRAGTNIATISSQFADGSTEYHSLLREMELGMGSTNRLYDEMTDNVLDQGIIVKSAFSELLISVFDTYADPLKELLVALSEVIAFTADQFNKASDDIANNVGSAFDRVKIALLSNKMTIAQFFISISERVATLITEINQIIMQFTFWWPWLQKVAQVFMAMWVVSKVTNFAVAILAVSSAVYGLVVAVNALGLGVAAATGGLSLLAAALTAGAVYFYGYESAADKATKAADEYRKTQAIIHQDLKDHESAWAAYTFQVGNATKVWAAGELVRRKSRGTLTDDLEDELKLLTQISDDQVRAGLEAGKLAEVNLGAGKRVVQSVRFLYETGKMGQDDYNDALSASRASLGNWQRQLSDLMPLIEAYDRNANNLSDGLFGAEHAQAALTVIQQKGFPTMVEARAEFSMLVDRVLEATSEYEGLQQAWKAAEEASKRSKAAKAARDAAEAAAEAGRNAKKWRDDFKSAAEDILKLTEKIREAWEDAFIAPISEPALQAERQIKEVVDVFDVQLGLLKKGSQAYIDVIKARDELIFMVRETAIRELRNQEAEAQEDNLDAARRALASEVQLKQMDRQAEFDELRDSYLKRQELAAGNNDLLTRIAQNYLMEKAALRKKFAAEDMRAMRDLGKAIDDIVKSEGKNRLDRIKLLEEEKAEWLLENEEATAAQVLRIEKHYNDLISKERQKITQEILELGNSKAARIAKLERELAEKLIEIPKDMLQERLALEKYYQKLIEDVRGGDDDDPEDQEVTRWEKTKELISRTATTLKDVYGGAVQAVTTVVGKLEAAWGKVLDVVQNLTGFSFDLVSAVGDVVSTMESAEEDAAKLREDLEAGTISLQEYNQQMSDLPSSASEAARNYINDLVNAAVTTVQTFAEAAPELLSELAASIPDLVTAIVASIPDIVQGIADNIEPIIDALIEGSDQVVSAIADSLPDLVQELVQKLPDVVDQLGDDLQILIGVLQEIIVAVIEGIPAILTEMLKDAGGIVDSILDLVMAVIESIDDVIVQLMQDSSERIADVLVGIVRSVIDFFISLFDADVGQEANKMVGGLVTGIIDAVVGIIDLLAEKADEFLLAFVESLVQSFVGFAGAIQQIIQAVITGIPDIIQAIVELIPELIMAVVDSIPLIITELVAGIGELLTNSINFIIQELPTIISEMTMMLIEQFPIIVAELVTELMKQGFQFVKDLLAEIFSLGSAVTETFNPVKYAAQQANQGGPVDSAGVANIGGMEYGFSDTPGVIRAGFNGLAARFAANDYIVAAQSPTKLLAMAARAVGAAGRLGGGSVSVPALSGLPGAILQAGGSGGPNGAPLQVTVTAEGKTLDSVMYLGHKRGSTPRLDKMMRRAAGGSVHLGFYRGKYSPAS